MKQHESPVGLIISRDGSDEVCLYFITKQAFNECYAEIYKCPFDKDEAYESITKIIDNKENVISKIFTQTFCHEAVNFTYNIIGIITIPVY